MMMMVVKMLMVMLTKDDVESDVENDDMNDGDQFHVYFRRCDLMDGKTQRLVGYLLLAVFPKSSH